MTRRRTSPGVGLFAAPVAPVTAKPPGGNQVESEIADWVRQEKNIALVQRLRGGGNPVAEQQGIPPAATLTEAVTAATSIAGLHKGAAETAMAEREAAEKRADKAAAEAEGKAERARGEEEAKGLTLLTIVKEFSMAAQENLKAVHGVQLQLQAQVDAAERKGLEARLDGLEQRYQAALQAKDEKIAELVGKVQALAGRETLEDRLARVLIDGDLDDPGMKAVVRLFSPPAVATDDPEVMFRKGIAQVKVEEARRSLDHADEEVQLKRERQKAIMGIVNNVGGLIGEARQWLPSVLAGQVRRPDSVVPEEWPAAETNGHHEAPPAPPPAPVHEGEAEY